MLDIADYLFPRDLEASEVKFKRCLLIGSCMIETSLRALRERRPETQFDLMLFNNIAELTDEPPLPVGAYDFQYIQLPIRSIIGDVVIRFQNFLDPKLNEEIIVNAHQALKLMLEYALKYNKRYRLLSFVQNFIVPQLQPVVGIEAIGSRFDMRTLVESLNAKLAELIAGYDNVQLIDAEAIASTMGKRYFYDDNILFFTHGGYWFPDWVRMEKDRIEPVPPLGEISVSHRMQFIDAIWRACEYNYRVIQQIDSVKLVIFDLDDTLWRGLIGEHYQSWADRPGYEGWPLGVHEAIQHLRARGILVAICSKNSPQIVRERWERAVPLQWIKLEDFVAVEIGWRPKAESVGRILAQVSLTPRNVLFVDDNPVERESIRAAFPGIRTIGDNPFTIRRILLAAPETQIRVLTRESAARDTMMRKQIERDSERDSMTREQFLANLNARVSMGRFIGASDPRFARTFELLNKTNQFNTDGKRWTLQEINAFFAEGGQIITFNVVDKFTEYGLVGVILLGRMRIVQFVMSCRVLGLEVEVGVLNFLVRVIRFGGDLSPIAANIVETQANLPAREVFQKAGFVDRGDGAFAYEAEAAPEIPAHLWVDWA